MLHKWFYLGMFLLTLAHTIQNILYYVYENFISGGLTLSAGNHLPIELTL
jgi:hypothetical protein